MTERGTYPQTAEEMLDRLIADRSFRIRMIVADNFPAVKAKHDQALAFGNRTPYTTPEALTNNILWLDEQQFNRDLVDSITAVPFRGSSSSRILTEAMAMGADMVTQAGAAPKNIFAGALAGIGGIVSGIGNIANGRNAIAAEERVNTQAITANAFTEAEKTARNERLIRLALIAGSIVAVIAILIIFRKR